MDFPHDYWLSCYVSYDDVKALVGAAAAAGGAEFADRAAGAVGARDREDVAEIGDGTVIGGDPGRGRRCQNDS
jgi:hypothetical protein